MENKELPTYTCCLCGKKKVGYGNAPWPLMEDNGKNRCCDSCNIYKVIPARLEEARKNG